MMAHLDMTVPTTVVVTVWITLHVTNKLDIVIWDVIRDILMVIAAKVNINKIYDILLITAAEVDLQNNE